MGQKKYFNENIIAYDKHRPTYGIEIYKDIIDYSNINSDSFVVEIGCGTGQATKPFLETGCKLTAVEIGANLADFTKSKYAQYDNLSVINCRFENFETDNKSVDLIYSATAFHWIPEEIGYNKAKKMLKENGCLAVFWNTPTISNDNIVLKFTIQQLYNKYLPTNSSQSYEDRCKGIQWYFNYYGYHNVFFKLYHEYRDFDADSYIGLLHTYSDHMALPLEIRKAFFSELHDEISKHTFIRIQDTIDLHIGKK